MARIAQNSQRQYVTTTAAVMIIATIAVALTFATGSERASELLLTTAALVLGTIAIALPVGVSLSVLLVRTDLPGRGVLAALLGFLLLIPLYLQTGAWQAGFGMQGWFSNASGIELLSGLRAAIWVHAMAAIPWVALIAGVGLWMVEPELEEEARLYASDAQVLIRVTLRRGLPAIGIAGMWVAVTTAGEMTVTDLFRVRTTAEEVYLVFAATSDMQVASLELLPHIAVTAVVLLLCGLCCFRVMPRARAISTRPRHIFALGRFQLAALFAVALTMVVLVAVPLACLIYKAGLATVAQTGGPVAQNWRVDKLFKMVMFEPWTQFGDEMLSSLIIGALASTTAVLFGMALAWIGRKGRLPAASVCMLVAILFSVPGPLLGAGVSRLLTYFPAVYDSYGAPGTAIGLRVLPMVILVCWHALRLVPEQAIDTARVAGAGFWACLFKVAMPICYPALAAAWLVAFLAGLGDLSASQLLQLPGRETLAARVFDRLHSGAYDQVCGLFIAMTIAFAAATTLAVKLFMLARRRAERKPR